MQANEVPGDVFSKFFPGADEIADMFSFFHNYGYFGEKVSKRDILFISLLIIYYLLFLFIYITLRFV